MLPTLHAAGLAILALCFWWRAYQAAGHSPPCARLTTDDPCPCGFCRERMRQVNLTHTTTRSPA